MVGSIPYRQDWGGNLHPKLSLRQKLRLAELVYQTIPKTFPWAEEWIKAREAKAEVVEESIVRSREGDDDEGEDDMPYQSKRGRAQTKTTSKRYSVSTARDCFAISDDSLKSVKAAYSPGDEVKSAAYAGFKHADDARRWCVMPAMLEPFLACYQMGAPKRDSMWPRMHHIIQDFIQNTLPKHKDDQAKLREIIRTNLDEAQAELEYEDPSELQSVLRADSKAREKQLQASVLAWLLCSLVHKVSPFWTMSTSERQKAYDTHVQHMDQTWKLKLPAFSVSQLGPGPKWRHRCDKSDFEAYNRAFCYLCAWLRKVTGGKRDQFMSGFARVFDEKSFSLDLKGEIVMDNIPFWMRNSGPGEQLPAIVEMMKKKPPSQRSPRAITVVWDTDGNAQQEECNFKTGLKARRLANLPIDWLLGFKCAGRSLPYDPRDEDDQGLWRDRLRLWLRLPDVRAVLYCLFIMDSAVTQGQLDDPFAVLQMWNQDELSMPWEEVQRRIEEYKQPCIIFTVALPEPDDQDECDKMESLRMLPVNPWADTPRQ